MKSIASNFSPRRMMHQHLYLLVYGQNVWVGRDELGGQGSGKCAQENLMTNGNKRLDGAIQPIPIILPSSGSIFAQANSAMRTILIPAVRICVASLFQFPSTQCSG